MPSRPATAHPKGGQLLPGHTLSGQQIRCRGAVRGGSRLVEDLAGVRLTAKRVERAAEASGAAVAATAPERARLIGRGAKLLVTGGHAGL
jgi:hypothetical protein